MRRETAKWKRDGGGTPSKAFDSPMCGSICVTIHPFVLCEDVSQLQSLPFQSLSVFSIISNTLILQQRRQLLSFAIDSSFNFTCFQMRSLILFIFLLAVQALAYVSRLPQGRTERTCSTPPPSDEIVRAHRRMRLQPRDVPPGSIQVAAYFHVVRSPEKEKWVTAAMISNQVCDSPREFDFSLLIPSRSVP